MAYALTKKHRRQVCMHEAAHAVIEALAGGTTYRIQVAPEGATMFTAQGRKGGVHDDVWGLHSGGDMLLLPHYWQWCDEGGRYVADRRAFEHFWGQVGMGALEAQRGGLRRQTCIVLAGPIADSIQDGSESPTVDVFNAYYDSPGEDCALAWGFVQLLPWRNEFESLAEQTEAALRAPMVWQCVQALADEVERVGDLDDAEVFARLLPKPVPGWPASPRGKAVAVN